MTDLLELATRVEGLDGPDHEVDAEIWNIINPTVPRSVIKSGLVFNPTASLDASASLMPEGWRISNMQEHVKGFFSVELWFLKKNKFVTGEAKTECNARTAAALRAIASEAGEA